MFFQYKTNYETWVRLRLGYFSPLPPAMHLTVDRLVEEIITDEPWPKCKIYRVSELGSEFFPDVVLTKEQEELPEIISHHISMVSERVRCIIEDVDDFEHQFVPFNFRDSEGNVLDIGQYYHFHIRRRLVVEKTGHKIKGKFSQSGDDFLGTIQNIPELREKVETLPVWKAGAGALDFFC